MREKKLTILLLEDDKVDAALLQKMLDGALAGLSHLHRAEQLANGMDFLASNAVDLVLLDLRLPDSHGLETLTSLQTAFPNLPIVVLTGDDTLGARAVENGAQDYLVKGNIDSKRLVQTIRYAVGRQQILNRLTQAMEEVSNVNTLLKQVLSFISDGVVIVDGAGIIRFANTSAATLFDTDCEGLVDSPFGFPITVEERAEIRMDYGEQPIFLEMRSVKFQWGGSGATLVFLRDVTEQKQLQENLVYLAQRDPLTGLANRTSLMDYLKKAIASVSQSKNGLVAVFFLHIDRLGRINDTLGHAMGDLLLKEITKRLTIFTRGDDNAARVSGDEFVIILSNLTPMEAVSSVAQKIIDRLSEPYFLKGNEWEITLSIGISIYPNDARDPETLLEYAEMALHRGKKDGKNAYHYYSPTLQAKAKERLTVENSLRSAFHQQDLFLVYQPIVSIATGRIAGMEVLLRWKHAEMGVLSPSQFIPVAEETGMIVKIGTWVLLHACAQNRAWQDMGLSPITMAVNLSAIQLKEPDFISVITRTLNHTGLAPQYLELEMTESMMQDTECALHVLRSLHEIGVLSSIDDFGTGYSSLSHLRQFPFDTLKIDISFIRNMMRGEDDRNLVETIITMAHNFRLRTIAEGVETAEQLEVLQSLGCDEVQGFYLSKPLSADLATLRLSEQTHFF
jgi:diguanylate cyclase (GGDEF)-like protein